MDPIFFFLSLFSKELRPLQILEALLPSEWCHRARWYQPRCETHQGTRSDLGAPKRALAVGKPSIGHGLKPLIYSKSGWLGTWSGNISGTMVHHFTTWGNAFDIAGLWLIISLAPEILYKARWFFFSIMGIFYAEVSSGKFQTFTAAIQLSPELDLEGSTASTD